ncbi:hypothetical protein, partial [Xanthomonas oryzae]|uniref:hypothetical protein n=2 Tax=Pseudomonadota TaxID=1224 RepID=UPI001C4CFFDB
LLLHLNVDRGISPVTKAPQFKEPSMAKKAKKRTPVRYSKDDIKALKAHSRARTPLKRIAKEMKRTEGSLRQKALKLGIGLGHQR